MQKQNRIIRSVVLITALAIIAIISIIPSSTGYASAPQAPENQPFTVFLPVVNRPAPPPAVTTQLGFELTNMSATYMVDELKQYNLGFIRGNLGYSQDPASSPYQLYLSGGWAAADAKVLPNIEAWRAAGAEPLLIFMPGGACSAPSYALLDSFGDFVAAAVERYDLKYFEVWNEPEVAGGFSSLFGCLGTAHADKLIYLLQRIRPQLDNGRQMGVSFMMDAEAHLEMMKQIAPHVDFVGIHHYGIWTGQQVIENAWTVSLESKYERVKAAAAGRPVWITELNLRSPDDACGIAHQEAARDYIESALELGAPMISILVYKAYPDWQCTGVRDTLMTQQLKTMMNP